MSMQETPPIDRRAMPIANGPRGKNHMICPNPNCGYRGDAKIRHAFPPIIAILMVSVGFAAIVVSMLLAQVMHDSVQAFESLTMIAIVVIFTGFGLGAISLIKQRTCPKCSMKVSY